jgi:hypothetical protein
MKVRITATSLVTLIAIFSLSSCFTGMVNTRISRVYGDQSADPREFIAAGNVNGAFPERVYIKTLTQTFNESHYFLLSENRIWYKSIDPEGDVPAWKLFRETGLPSARLKRGFVKPSAIVAISADANELQAISDTGRIYQYVFDPGLLIQDYFWKDHLGWPEGAPLVVNDLVRGFRSWAVSKRTSSVLWYEDRFGNQHHYGTMGIENSYFLCADGQEIRYTDTGLPSDFSHAILGPERGRFVAESLSASASTMFVIDAAGDMYTRLADFDTLGCDPLFFRYTYRARDYGLPGSNYRSNYTPWGLPSEDWKREPPIPLEGMARVTRRITILQNGKGNLARELRVAGLDRAGRVGYYVKGIGDAAWSFAEAPLLLSERDFLDPVAASRSGLTRGPSSDARYFGVVLRSGTPISDLSLEIPDFNLSEGSCALLVSRNGETARLSMHPVDAWTYFRRYDPGRDGTAKLMMVTLEIPDGALASLSPEFADAISAVIAPYDREPFAFTAEATEDYLFVHGSKSRMGDMSFFFSADPAAIRVNPDIYRRMALGNDALIAEFSSPELEFDLPESGVLSPDGADMLERVIAKNREFRLRLGDSIRMYSSYRLSSSISGKTYSVFNALSHVTFLYLLDFPKINTVTRHGSAIMKGNQRNAAAMTEAKYWIYRKVIDLLDIRIELYGEMLKASRERLPPPESLARYSETFQGYFRLTGIPGTLSGVWRGDESPVSGISTSELFESEIPELLIVTREESPRIYLVDFKTLPADIYRRKSLDFARDPLSVAVEISPLMVPGVSISDLMSSANAPVPATGGMTTATLEWNGSVLTIWKASADGGRELLFTSNEG